MRLASVKNAVTSNLARKLLLTRKHSPVLLFGVGVAGFIGTIVLATRATFKMEEVIKEGETLSEEIASNPDLSEKDASKELNKVRVQIGLKTLKLYAPAIGTGVLSIGCLTGAHVIQARRLGGITAAYAVVDQAYREYRKRVTDEFGEDVDARMRYGLVEQEVIVSEGPEGPVMEKVLRPNGSKPSMYAQVFQYGNPNWQKGRHDNQTFLQVQQSYANDLYERQGYLFLSDVYKMLGFDETKASRVVGWIKGNGDGYIDFGLFRHDPWAGFQFVNGEVESVVLDFNVDGVVWDKLAD